MTSIEIDNFEEIIDQDDDEDEVCHLSYSVGYRPLCGAVSGYAQSIDESDFGLLWCTTCGSKRCPECAEIYIRTVHGSGHDSSSA